MTTLASIKTKKFEIEQAGIAYSKQRAQLYTADGKPLLNDSEKQKANVQAALAPLRAAVDSAMAIAEQAVSEAGKLATRGGYDWLTQLSTDELQRYAVLRTVITDGVKNMTPAALQARLEYMRDWGTGLERRLYLEALRQLKPTPGTLGGDDGLDRFETVQAIEKLLADEPAAKAAAAAAFEARTLQQAAQELRSYARATLGDATGTAAAEKERAKGHLQATF